MILAIFLLCLGGFIYAMVLVNHYYIETQNEYILHSVWVLMRITYFAVAAYLYSTEFVHIAILMLFQAAVFWLFFDLGINLKRNLDWDYIGENSAIDRFFSKRKEGLKIYDLLFTYQKQIMFTAKATLIIISTGLIIKWVPIY